MKNSKKYNKITKKYGKINEGKLTDLKKRKECRGGREHDFVLVLPFHRHFSDATEPTAKSIQEYYKIKDELYEFAKAINDRIKKLGINNKYLEWDRYETREFICLVCGKIKREYK